MIYINTDGGSRGNPGPAAIGVVFFDKNGEVLYKYKKTIGVGTNNEAEYQAIITALGLLKQSKWFSENNNSDRKIICRLDSKLVVEQLSGRFKIKTPHIKSLAEQVFELTKDFKLDVKYTHIPREENSLADELVNQALDEAK